MAKSKMSSPKNMIMSNEMWAVLGIAVGIILVMVFSHMTSSKENLNIKDKWKKFTKWVEKNINKSDEKIIALWREWDEEIEETKKKREEELKKYNEEHGIKPLPAQYYKDAENRCKARKGFYYPFDKKTQFELWKRFQLLKGLNGYYGECQDTDDEKGNSKYVCCPFKMDTLANH